MVKFPNSDYRSGLHRLSGQCSNILLFIHAGNPGALQGHKLLLALLISPTECIPHGSVRTTENGALFRIWHNLISAYHGLNTLLALSNCVHRLLLCF